MTPDPTREWYVYFKEQEMGPLTESDLQTKVSQGELDSSAFVFTEGMSDWTALDEVSVLSNGGAQSPASQKVKAKGVVETRHSEPDPETVRSVQAPAPASEPARSSMKVETVGKGGFEENDVSTLERKLDSDKQKREASKRPLILRWLLIGCFVVLALAFVLDYSKMIPQLGGGTEPAPATAPVANPQNAATAPQAKSNELDVIWSELSFVRLSQDRQGPPFRISSVLLSPDRPVLMGSISGLIKTDKIHLVIYPDLARSLLETPRVWWFDVQPVDGFFAVGPLNIDGRALPAGTYKVMAQALGKYLGAVSFEVGKFPTGPELEVAMKSLQNTRAMASSEELKKLEALFRDFDALYESLRENVVANAIKGAPRRAAWTRAMGPWTTSFQKTFASLSDQSALTYYPELRSRLDSLAKELVKVQGLMDFYSTNGRAGFEKRAGRRYSEIWNALQADRDFLKSEFLSQASQTQTEARLNEDQLKARLLEKR
jgi:hypothetical protein